MNSPHAPAVVDFETYWAQDYSLSSMTTESYVRDPRFKVHGAGIKVGNGKTVWVTQRKLPAVFAALNLQQRAIVGHNLLFDGSILAWHYGIVPKLYVDTLGVSRAILGAHLARHGLAYVAEFLTGSGKTGGLAATRGIRELPPTMEQTLAEYCINDVEKTHAVCKILLPHMPRKELRALDWTVRVFTQPRLLLDTDMLRDYHAYVLQRKAQALVDAGLVDRTSLMSNDKFAAALEALGVMPPTKVNAKGKVAFAFAKTDEGLKALLEHDDVRVQALVAARLEVKSTIEETRALRLLDASTRGYWPVPYNYAGANTTQRHSGADKVNAQNFQRVNKDDPNSGMLRKSICAREGYTLGVADLAQIECRLVLWLGTFSPKSTGTEREALDKLANGEDLYGWFGTLIYGREINKKDTPLERQIAKAAVLGLGYGMGVVRFIAECKKHNIPMDATLAERIVNLYRNTFRGVKHIWGLFQRALNLAAASQEADLPPLPCVTLERDPWGAWSLRRPSGLRIKYPGLRVDGNGEMFYLQGSTPTRIYGPKAVENTCQALAGDIIREQLVELDSRGFPGVLTTHDEGVNEVELGREAEYIAAATEIMTRPILWAPGLPLGTEVSCAQRYGDAK